MKNHIKTALVTGAGSGIGYEICRHLALAGARVALNDMDADLAHKAAHRINAEAGGRRVAAFAADVADVPAVRAMIGSVVEHLGVLDVCVANAGVTMFGAFLEDEPAAFDRMTGVNLRGSYFTAQAAARVMVAQGHGGRIVLTSSVTGVQAHPRLGAYGVTKAGIRMMAKALAHELAPHCITVNAVCPGATATERTMSDPDYAAKWSRVIPTGRNSTVDDITAAVLFLCSDGAAQITGQSLIIDGGWTGYSPLADAHT